MLCPKHVALSSLVPCSSPGHSLRTWIPILILIQCALICLYIGIIQDKARAQPQDYAKKPQPDEKHANLRGDGVYNRPGHEKGFLQLLGSANYDNGGGNNNQFEAEMSEPSLKIDIPRKDIDFRGTGMPPVERNPRKGASYLLASRHHIGRLNATNRNSTYNEIAFQIGNEMKFQSGNSNENEVLVVKNESGMNNERQLSVGIQALESIEASSRAWTGANPPAHRLTVQAASNTLHHHSNDDKALTSKNNVLGREKSPSNAELVSAAENKNSTTSSNKVVSLVHESSRYELSHKVDESGGASTKGQNIFSSGKKDIDQSARNNELSASASRWRDVRNATTRGQRGPRGRGSHIAGPYSDELLRSAAAKLPSFHSAAKGETYPPDGGASDSPSRQPASRENQSVIASLTPASRDNGSVMGTKPASTGMLNPIEAANSTSVQNMYGIHTPHTNPLYITTKNSSHGGNLFHGYNPMIPGVFHLSEDNSTYFSQQGRGLMCMNEGTENVFVQGKQEACICKPSWHGDHCSVPDNAMYTSALKYINTLQIEKKRPRRIVNAIIFNIEWELLEARMHELGDLVDVYLLVESNYTMYGDKKPLRLLERLRQGYLQEFHHKIAYMFVDTFPVGGRENGWIVDEFLRNTIGKHGLQQISGLRPSDVFLYTDADEIPSRDVLLFLKLHSGYPEPFGLALRWSVFGFFWKQYDLTRIMAGCSINMLRIVFQNDVYKLRTGTYAVQAEESEGVKEFVKGGGIVLEWYFGDGGAHAGWHCSWCMPPDRVKVKLTSAINADFPRWGDYPEKRDLTYIRNLIKTGTWFDDKMTFNSLVDVDSDPNLAPSYMLDNFEKYRHLLDLKYAG